MNKIVENQKSRLTRAGTFDILRGQNEKDCTALARL
jgi:hypothetical protein